MATKISWDSSAGINLNPCCNIINNSDNISNNTSGMSDNYINYSNMSVTGISNFCGNASNATEMACKDKAQGISLSTPILMFTTGAVGNILALVILYSGRKEVRGRRTVFFVMLSGLAWTDLLGLTATSPIAIIMYANNLKWVGGVPLCRYHGFMMVTMGLVTPLIVCCMSLERFLAIQFSYFYARHVSRSKAFFTFTVCWTGTLAFASLPFTGLGSYEFQFPGSWCFLNFHKESSLDTFYAALFSMLNIIAIGIMVFCNVSVAWTLIRLQMRRTIKNSPAFDRKLSISQIGGSNSGTVIRTRRHSSMEAQMIWFLCLITVVFSVCWLPLNVHIMITQITGVTDRKMDLLVVRMASCNQILDPWLYVIFRKNSFMRIFRRIRGCLFPNSLRMPPPKHPRHQKIRYVICNNSFTCDGTTFKKTGPPRDTKTSPTRPLPRAGSNPSFVTSPKYLKVFQIPVTVPEQDHISESDCTDDSDSKIIPVCPLCYQELEDGKSKAYPVYDLSPGMSPTERSNHSSQFCFQFSETGCKTSGSRLTQKNQPTRNLFCIFRTKTGKAICRLGNEDERGELKFCPNSLPVLDSYREKTTSSSTGVVVSEQFPLTTRCYDSPRLIYHSVDSDHPFKALLKVKKRSKPSLRLPSPFCTFSVTESPEVSPTLTPRSQCMPMFSSPSNSMYFSNCPDIQQSDVDHLSNIQIKDTKSSHNINSEPVGPTLRLPEPFQKEHTFSLAPNQNFSCQSNVGSSLPHLSSVDSDLDDDVFENSDKEGLHIPPPIPFDDDVEKLNPLPQSPASDNPLTKVENVDICSTGEKIHSLEGEEADSNLCPGVKTINSLSGTSSSHEEKGPVSA